MQCAVCSVVKYSVVQCMCSEWFPGVQCYQVPIFGGGKEKGGFRGDYAYPGQ